RVRPLLLVVGTTERGGVDQGAGADDPLGEVVLTGGFLGEGSRCNGIALEDDRGDAGLLELRDHARGLLLQARGIERVWDAWAQIDSGATELVSKLVGVRLLVATGGRDEQVPKDTVLLLERRITRELGGLVRQTLGDVLGELIAALIGGCAD